MWCHKEGQRGEGMKQSSLNGNGNGTGISEHNGCNEETANTQSYTHTYIYILFPMMGVYWMKFTYYSATLDNACTHNMSTTRGKHKHTTNKHGPLPPHPPVRMQCGMRSHITTRSRGGAVHNTHCQCCTSCSAQLNTHHRAPCRQQCTPDRQ